MTLEALPLWTGTLAAVLAVAIVILGRHGQRLANAALLASASVWCSLHEVKIEALPWLPGVLAIGLTAALLLASLFSLRIGTGLLLAAFAAPAAALAAPLLKLDPIVPAAASAVIAFCFGLVNAQRFSLFLAPVSAAALAWFAAERLLHLAWPLDAKLASAGLLAVLLVLITAEREHRRKKRIAANAKAKEEAALKAKVAAQQAAWKLAHRKSPS